MNFTALSFVDLKELTTDNIVEVNGEKWIVGKHHKTGVPYQVKLLEVPLQIIERYRDYPKENPKSVFGEVNYWSVCKKLKPVMKECGFNMEQTEKLLYGQCINYSGWLHSNEYRRNALANDVTAQVIMDEKRFLFLRINDTPVVQWFKEQFGLGQEQRRGIKI